MTKIDIISGFLGAGKTTLLKKLLHEAYIDENIVIIENEFGEIGIDGGFLKESGVQIKEMNSGCICCSLVGDFAASLEKVMQEYQPQRIIIEPSGVGKLSDVVKAVKDLHNDDIQLNSLTCVVDGNKCALYMKNFGEFFNNQVENAQTIILSRTQLMDAQKIATCVALLQQHNPHANLITTPWDELDGKQIVDVMQRSSTLEKELMDDMDICPVCHHHHEEHHHEHHEECGCGHHHEEHHHHADDVFQSWGSETVHTYSEEQLRSMFKKISADESFGVVLRAKGMVQSTKGTWLYFDFVPEEFEIREGSPVPIGKICVIGSALDEEKLSTLFLLKEEVA